MVTVARNVSTFFLQFHRSFSFLKSPCVPSFSFSFWPVSVSFFPPSPLLSLSRAPPYLCSSSFVCTCQLFSLGFSSLCFAVCNCCHFSNCFFGFLFDVFVCLVLLRACLCPRNRGLTFTVRIGEPDSQPTDADNARSVHHHTCVITKSNPDSKNHSASATDKLEQ